MDGTCVSILYLINKFKQAIVRLGGTRFKENCEALRFKRLDANLPPAMKGIFIRQ